MKFDQLAGILKVHDLERVEELPKGQKGVAFVAESKEDDLVKRIEDNMVLMAKNFSKMIKRVEKGQNRSNNRYQSKDSERSSNPNSRNDSSRGNRRKDLQCHECDAFGHFRNECPLTKRKELKCIECKGYGHTRSECPNNLKEDKSLMCFSDTESDSDSDNEVSLRNFVALMGQDELHEDSSNSKSNSDEDPGEEKDTPDLKSENLFDKFTELSLENLQLIKDRAMLKAQVNILELEAPAMTERQDITSYTDAEKEDRQALEKTISDQI